MRLANRRRVAGSGGVGETAAASTGLLASRIGGLELEERAAMRRRDWATARRAAVEKAALKEAQHRASAGRREKR